MSRGSTFSGPRPHYLRIANGKIVETVDANDPHAVKRVNKNGLDVYERIDDYVDGMLMKITFRERDKFGGAPGEKTHSTAILLEDEGEYYQLEMDHDSRVWSHFCQRVPNIDTSKVVRFAPYDFTPKATREEPNPKRLRGLNVLQRKDELMAWTPENTVKLEWYWTQEKKGNLPDVVEHVIKGKTHYDDTARVAYWVDMLTRFAAKIAAEVAVTHQQPTPQGDERDEPEQLPPTSAGYGRTDAPQQAAPAPAAQAAPVDNDEDLPF